MRMQQTARPLPVTIVSIALLLFGLAAALGSLFLWGQGFLLSFPANMDYRMPIADLLVNAPASLMAAFGLWRMRRYGYVAAQFVAGFYTYASVEIFVAVAQGALPGSAAILAPQIVAVGVAALLVLYLWRIQDLFGARAS